MLGAIGMRHIVNSKHSPNEDVLNKTLLNRKPSLVILMVAQSQKVFKLWSHCQQKVPNHSPEQKISINGLLKREGNSNFLLKAVIRHLLSAMGRKSKYFLRLSHLYVQYINHKNMIFKVFVYKITFPSDYSNEY